MSRDGGVQNFGQREVSLTPKEIESITWTAEGKSSWEIGQITGTAERTVVNHLQSAMKKLGAKNRIHAVVTAARLGILKLVVSIGIGLFEWHEIAGLIEATI